MKNKEKIKLVLLIFILPIFLISIISTYAVTGLLSSEVSYDRTTSKLRSNNVQDAIDELNNKYKNAEDLKCPVGKKCSKYPASITYNANTGTFDNNETTNKIYYNVKTKISKTSNVDDEGNQTEYMPQASSGITDTVTIEGAESLEVEITYQTYSSSRSYVAVYDSTVTPTTSNYSSSISGKLYGTTQTTKTYTITGDTVKFFFYNYYSNTSTYSNYLGYYATVKEIGKSSKTYKIPIKENYAFIGWNTKEDGSGRTYKTKSEVNNVIEENNNITLYAQWGDYICKKATTLHETTCQSESGYGCRGAGIYSGATITYGQIGTSGTLAAGDAFDCDVNGDGTYDAATERFYYVSDYYDTSIKSFNSDVATLVYYKNNGSYAYYGTYDSYKNYYGPQKNSEGHIYYYLPSTSEWSNINLYKTIRQILTQSGSKTTSSSTLPNAYDYEDKAARFLTAQEINSACNITVKNYTTGELDTCKYLMENTRYDNSSYNYGYWLETPYSNDTNVWRVDGYFRGVGNNYAYAYYGARPVIEVLKSEIEY